MFEIVHQEHSSHARVGKLITHHQVVDTPAFMPVATKATVKSLTPQEIREMGTQAIISNAFHLYLSPGHDLIHEAGGLHTFMDWDGAIFTDSGGFQILRKEFRFKLNNQGISYFNSRDGKRYMYTPEMCMEIQGSLGSDVAMVLDDCPLWGSTRDEVRESVCRTLNWGQRSLEARCNDNQLVFAILQGGTYPEMRETCARKLVEMGFDGYGIGGLSIGEPKEVMHEIIRLNLTQIPPDKPRYLMGVGSPVELLESISLGVDIFDSAFPTRNARHQTVMTRYGQMDVRRSSHARDFRPIDEDCGCYTCQHFSRAYLYHLFKESELLALRLASIHNVHFLQELMGEARNSILEDRFHEFREQFKREYSGPANRT
ncbi:MAG: tRNA guanosine(34) transglycosylase Tgt [Methanosarcinales archaeon]|nr:tRNA guanosine(34) transglycosylase Tgt [ANME-2 cluster archaeon]MDF1530792.1 tRNA guanosine(34) transglycosylase Tgt [ANME-2 cluster archaeon]MDW7777119.1 tRNA guanosine(34) transglycosylase Tgt [Methanosarcinales archaeon]